MRLNGIIRLLFVALLATYPSLFLKAQQFDSMLVKEVFQHYKDAILKDKASDALQTIDSRTKKYYTDILHIVKKADSIGIDSLELIDKITVLRIRAGASREEIRAMQGMDVFLYAIKKGMVGKSSVVNNEIGEIKISGNFAKGQLVVSEQKTPFNFHFYKEEGTWKLDLTSLFGISNAAFKNMIKESGEEENSYLLGLLESLTGKKITSKIWQPVIKE